MPTRHHTAHLPLTIQHTHPSPYNTPSPHHAATHPSPCSIPTPHHTAYPPLIIQHTHPSSYSIPSPHCIEHHPVDKPLPSERKPYYTGYSPLWLRAQGRPNFWYYNVIYKCTWLHSQLFWDACDPWAAGWAHLLECVYAVTLTTVLFFLWLKFALKKKSNLNRV